MIVEWLSNEQRPNGDVIRVVCKQFFITLEAKNRFRLYDEITCQ